MESLAAKVLSSSGSWHRPRPIYFESILQCYVRGGTYVRHIGYTVYSMAVEALVSWHP